MIIEPFDYPAIDEKKIRDVTTIVEFDDPAVPHGLIMSKKALPPAEREKWRALVNEMRADGTVRRIFEKYFKPDLADSMVDFQTHAVNWARLVLLPLLVLSAALGVTWIAVGPRAASLPHELLSQFNFSLGDAVSRIEQRMGDV